MRIVSRPLVMILVAVLGATACGSTSQRLQLAQDGTPPTTKTQPSLAPQTPPVEGEVLPVPSIVPAVNDNSRDTPIGRLCWTRRDVVLAFAAQIPKVAGKDEPKLTSSDVAATYMSAVTQLSDIAPSQLPAELGPFLDRFKVDAAALEKVLNSGDTVTLDQLAAAFDFEKYPALSDYLKVATVDEGCTNP